MASDGKKDFNLNSIMTEIHFIKTWYDSLFYNNKIDIVKLIAEKSYGYKITSIVWNPEEKYKFGILEKINRTQIIQISEKIFDGDTTNIDVKYSKIATNDVQL
jgi:hypothetical protein